MDHNSQGEGDFVVDIESSRATNEETESPHPFSKEKLGNSFCAEVSGGLVHYDGLVDCENGLNVIITEASGCDGSPENLKVLINKEVRVKAEDLVASRTRNDRRKSTSAKKPPRPPRGYSLDAADQKFIKEIAELAMLKRSRVERMKALKKMKAAKASPVSNSRGNIFAMFFSILFFLVIVFHGISCSSSPTSQFQGSPEPASSVENFITLKHPKRFRSNAIYSTTSESPKLVNQISDSVPTNKLTKASG